MVVTLILLMVARFGQIAQHLNTDAGGLVVCGCAMFKFYVLFFRRVLVRGSVA